MRQGLLNPKFSILAIATVTLALGVSTSAQALPRQRVQTVVQWAKQHPILSPLKRGIGELSGLPFYNSQAKVNLGTFTFAMNPDRADQIVKNETIALATKTAFPGFTRTHSAGLNLIGKIYDQKLTTDFQKSAYIAKVSFNDYELKFYRGKTFGYVTTDFKSAAQDGQKYHHFGVVSLGDLSGRITATQQCRQQSAYGCE